MTAIQFAGQKMFAPLHMLKQNRKARIDFSVFAFCEKIINPPLDSCRV
jgi:hypothetical protein